VGPYRDTSDSYRTAGIISVALGEQAAEREVKLPSSAVVSANSIAEKKRESR
jgi:hypothetical protein